MKEREARAVLDSTPGVVAVTIDTILAELGDWATGLAVPNSLLAEVVEFASNRFHPFAAIVWR